MRRIRPGALVVHDSLTFIPFPSLMMALVQSNHLRFHTIQEILRQLWMQCNFSIRKDFEVYQEAHGMGSRANSQACGSKAAVNIGASIFEPLFYSILSRKQMKTAFEHPPTSTLDATGNNIIWAHSSNGSNVLGGQPCAI